MSERRGISAADYLGELVARAEEDELLAAMNDDFRALKADAGGWSLLEEERSSWVMCH